MKLKKMIKDNRYLFVIIAIVLAIQLSTITQPVVGYHNWKSTHYLINARNFAENHHFPPLNYWDKTNHYTGKVTDTFPIYSMLVGTAFMIFGEHIEIARGIDIIFGILSIIAFYFLIKKLSSKRMAEISTMFFALFPLYIYFTQNIMVLSTSMFFMLLSSYCFLEYYNEGNPLHLILSSAFFTIGFVTYYSFIITPLIFMAYIILRDVNNLKEDIKYIYPRIIAPSVVTFGIGMFFALLWIVYSNQFYKTHEMIINPSYFIKTSFWLITDYRLVENLSILGFIFFVVGIYLVMHKKNKFTISIIGLMILSWVIIMSRKLTFHSYHWFPLLPIFAICSTYTIIELMNKTKKKKLMTLTIVILLSYSFLSMYSNIFSVSYDGNKISGDYIATHGGGNVFHSSYQSYSVMWYAKDNGVPLPYNISEIQYLENNYNFRWIYICEWEFDEIPDDAWNYIEHTYNISLNYRDFALLQKSKLSESKYFDKSDLLLNRG